MSVNMPPLPPYAFMARSALPSLSSSVFQLFFFMEEIRKIIGLYLDKLHLKTNTAKRQLMVHGEQLQCGQMPDKNCP